MKRPGWIRAWFVAVMIVGTSSSGAPRDSELAAASHAIMSVSLPEMPAKAAEMVGRAGKNDRKALTVTIIKTIMSRHKAVGRLAVSSIAKISPESAPIAAATAAELNNEDAIFIATAAAASAPSQAIEVADSVVAVVPLLSSHIYEAVHLVVPSTAPALSLRIISSTRSSVHTGPPTSGSVSQSNFPINTANRQGPGGNSFPNPVTNPPQDVGLAFPTSFCYCRLN